MNPLPLQNDVITLLEPAASNLVESKQAWEYGPLTHTLKASERKSEFTTSAESIADRRIAHAD